MPQAKVNGLQIEYETFGREGDPAVLLIMGFSAQLIVWPLALCEGLAALGFRVIRFDNRDVGKSTHLIDLGVPDINGAMMALMTGKPVARAPYLLDDMAVDAVGLLDALGIEAAHIVGASMGGMIAQIVAAKYPARVKSLVSIMSTTGKRSLPPAKPEVLAALMTPPASLSREDRMAAGLRIWKAIGSPGFPSSEEEMREFVASLIDRVPYEPTGAARQMYAIMVSEPRNEILSHVHCPALVIHGANDPLIPVEGGRDTAESIPGARLVIVPGMAHDFAGGLLPILLKEIGDFLVSSERCDAA